MNDVSMTATDRHNSITTCRLNNHRVCSSDEATLGYILKRFCQRTSLRGIPRILTAENRPLRWLWIMFVFGLMLACMLNLYYIIKLYLEYDVVQMPTLRSRTDAAFPSVTLCNQVPLSAVGEQIIHRQGWKTPKEFWLHITDMVFRKIPNMNIPLSDRQILDTYFGGFLSRNSYWSNIPQGHDPKDLGFSIENLIRKCFIIAKNHVGLEPPLIAKRCHEMGTWKRIQDQNRLNCYTYTSSRNITFPLIEMEMLLYLGYNSNFHCSDCIKQDVNSQITGARVVLHEHGSYPDTNKEGFNVYPGTLTEVRFSTINWTRLEAPYGNCLPHVPSFIDINSDNFSYTKETCRKLHRQDTVKEVCGCTFGLLPRSSKDMTSFCERLDGDINNFTAQGLVDAAKKTRCALLEMFKIDEYDSHCQQPCHYFTYETSTTQALWPRETMKLDIFKSQFKEKLLINESDSVRELFNKMQVYIESDPQKARRILKESNLIEQSFVTLKISRKDFTVTEIHDKPVRTLASTLSQIGGLFSMWVGLTFIWIVELIELSLRIIQHFIQRFNQPRRNLSLHLPNKDERRRNSELPESEPMWNSLCDITETQITRNPNIQESN